jgi:hypothetical protein
MINQKTLKELLHYNPGTGIFTWNKEVPNRPYLKGEEAGSNSHGYVVICIDYTNYHAHRLAFLFMEGYLPENQIDHKDRIRHHNWWNNLREASQQCQNRNSSLSSINTSGVKGVCWDSGRSKWQVNIKIDNKYYFLGRFPDFTEAVAHRFAAEQCIGWGDCDTNSSAGNYLKGWLWMCLY